MDRHLAIALTSAALAFFFGLGLRWRIREGYTEFEFQRITKRDNPRTFWTIMAVLAAIDVVLVWMAIYYFVAWLKT